MRPGFTERSDVKSAGRTSSRGAAATRDLSVQPDKILDCYGLLCPVPVKKTAQALEELRPGQILEVIATDEWFGPDLEAWLRHHPHELIVLEQVGQEIHAYLRKTSVRPEQAVHPSTLAQDERRIEGLE